MDDAGDAAGGGRLETRVLCERWLPAFFERCLCGVFGVDAGRNGQLGICHVGVEAADSVQEYPDIVRGGTAAQGGEQCLQRVGQRLLGVLADGDVASWLSARKRNSARWVSAWWSRSAWWDQSGLAGVFIRAAYERPLMKSRLRRSASSSLRRSSSDLPCMSCPRRRMAELESLTDCLRRLLTVDLPPLLRSSWDLWGLRESLAALQPVFMAVISCSRENFQKVSRMQALELGSCGCRVVPERFGGSGADEEETLHVEHVGVVGVSIDVGLVSGPERERVAVRVFQPDALLGVAVRVYEREDLGGEDGAFCRRSRRRLCTVNPFQYRFIVQNVF